MLCITLSGCSQDQTRMKILAVAPDKRGNNMIVFLFFRGNRCHEYSLEAPLMKK